MVYLVGAGIGDASLITLRGMECIKQAEVIIYDHLANPSLLNYAKDGCRLIYAGKSAGNHHMAQEEINNALIKYGRNKTVVRLKGGDPLVFGRGGEEAEELIRHGVEYEFIPGISSSYGAAEYAGIPVTHRGTASSFHVITGHEKRGGGTVDYEALAKLNGTLVFLMGLGAADNISEQLMRYGKNPETKAAVISSAAGEKQKCAAGTLKSLPLIARKMTPPAVIIVGDVVGLRREWYKPSGKKILATGTKHMCENIKKAFKNIPLTEISLIKTTKINYDRFENTADFSHIAFTSVSGAEIFFEYLKKSKRDIRMLCDIKLAAVGKKTASYLFEKGIICDIIPATHSGAALACALAEENIKNILLIRAENGSPSLPEGLSRRGIPYTDLPLYKTETDFSKKELLNLCAPDMDYIILSSGSGARAYSEMAENKTNAKFIAIGSETARTAAECGIEIYRTAPVASAEGLYECINGDDNDD